MAGAVEWAAGQVGSAVVTVGELTGGMTSTMLALTHDDGTESVLRLIDREPWRTRGEGLAAREHETQVELAGTDVPAPRSLGLDAAGEACGAPGHLMTLVPGVTDDDRVDDASLGTLSEALAAVHTVVPSVAAREYESWAWEAKYVVPAWAEHPTAWEAAFDLLRAEPPAYEPTFIHRDFQLRNVLWTDDRVTGVVDWVETSTGPAWLDVAHCATNIALHRSPERAEAFVAAYTAVTGRVGDPYWEVMDAVGFLPPPGRDPMFTDPDQLRRLEQHLVARLR